MDSFVAVAVATPLSRHGWRPVEVARAATAAALTALVLALAPAATLNLAEGESGLLCDGRPIVGMAREPGRLILLCGPRPADAWQRRGRPGPG
jgi:hypothetical protein